MRTLVWLRRDLRTQDNTALLRACERSTSGVIACYAVTPAAWRAHDEAPAKIRFWLENLRALRERLEELRVPLRIVVAQNYEALPATIVGLAREVGASAVHANAEYEVNERRRDRTVGEALACAGIEWHLHHDRTVLPPDHVRTQQNTPYSVFTPFKRAWIERARQEDLRPRPMPPVQVDTGLASDPFPEHIEGFEFTPARLDLWPAGEEEARRRLDRFVERRIRAYKDQRDFPGIAGTSALSPYLAAGVLSPRQCLDAALQANGSRYANGEPGIDTWISELVWREFYAQVLVAWPRVCMQRAFKPELDERVEWRHDEDDFAAWKEGRTGYPIVDAAMRQLLRTGWMHNRLRMVTAMFLTKHLLIDWREGERFFMRHLVDGDFASNNGGWQWSASVGTDAAPYFRIFNPMTQSARFDPDGAFLLRFLPEFEGVSGKALHDPRVLGESERNRRNWPELIVDPQVGRERALAAFGVASGG
jgi:deoxyribodipyrimidine photo-lyase